MATTTTDAGIANCARIDDRTVECSWEKSATFTIMDSPQTLGWSDLLGLLAIILALAAYIGAIRLMGIQRSGELTAADAARTKKNAGTALSADEQVALDKKIKLENRIACLAIPDFFLVVSGLSLIFYLFAESIFPWSRSGLLLSITMWSFVVAILILVLFHMAAWIQTILLLRKR